MAFQSSVSTDHSQNFILRCCARLSVPELYPPPGGRNAQGAVPTRVLCSAMARSICVACAAADRVDMSGWFQVWLPSR